MSQLPSSISQFCAVNLAAGHKVFVQGQSCDNYIVISSGSVKVFSRSINGKELILYRIKQHEICVLTTSCLMGNSRYPAEAITESAVTAHIIPRKDFEQLLASSDEFREFVFHSFSARLADLMSRIELIALESVAYRLNNYLFNNADDKQHIKATHQEIAVEIGSAREVVSRHLKSLEKQQAITIHRGYIELLAPNALLD